MASYFNLTLDTLAPAGVSLTINDVALQSWEAMATIEGQTIGHGVGLLVEAGTAGTIEKECLIENNHIKVKLEPEETVGYLSNAYQIRVFDSEGDVFQIIQGFIYIRKAHKPYITNPLGGE